jgi:hypothetical protein
VLRDPLIQQHGQRGLSFVGTRNLQPAT